MNLFVLVVVSLVLAWVLFVLVLAVARPRGMDFRAAKAFVPDVVRLLRGLALDPLTSRGVRVRLGICSCIWLLQSTLSRISFRFSVTRTM